MRIAAQSAVLQKGCPMKPLLLLATSLSLCSQQPALAETRRSCAPRDQVVARLTESFGESRQAIGLGVNNTLVEVFASAETGSWTIITTTPAGITCLLASGLAFEQHLAILPTLGKKV